MARCKSCGVELRTGARFCDMCGAKVEKICPNCGEVLRAQAKFCDLCGEKLPLAQLISRPKVHGDICAGRLHTVALKEDGTLLATGDNMMLPRAVRSLPTMSLKISGAVMFLMASARLKL